MRSVGNDNNSISLDGKFEGKNKIRVTDLAEMCFIDILNIFVVHLQKVNSEFPIIISIIYKKCYCKLMVKVIALMFKFLILRYLKLRLSILSIGIIKFNELV